jgi:ABC-type Fe3+/spermidine/putrescine transport system ATPase subunit
MVFQDLALWPHLTVYQNLEFALKAQRLSADVRKQRIGEVLAHVRLDEFSGIYPARLSGGQQQRVAIARALVAQLDDDLRDELCGHLLDLHSQIGFTLVYVMHSKEEMRRIGTRAILLPDGKEASV